MEYKNVGPKYYLVGWALIKFDKFDIWTKRWKVTDWKNSHPNSTLELNGTEVWSVMETVQEKRL